MSPGSHAADDGSFRRSTGIQLGRALLLVAVAAVVGIVLLHHAGGGATRVSSAVTTTTAKPHGATTTTAAASTTTAPLRPPAQVKVLVANGSGVQGLAALISGKLHTAGYDVLASVNATQRVAASVVYYAPGYNREAATLAQTLGLPATSVQALPTAAPVSSLGTANVLVVAGPDLAQGTAPPTTAAHAPTTLHVSTTVTTAHTTTTTHPATTTSTVKP